MIKVALVDDHAILRDPLSKLIDEFEGYKVVCLAANGREFIDHIASHGAPDIVILDLNMPVMDGYDTALYLQKTHPALLVLMLSAYDSEIVMVRLLRLGVKGFMRKDVSPSELKKALTEVQERGFYYGSGSNNSLSTLACRTLNEGPDGKSHILTDREIELLKLCCSDMTYKEIAGAMQLSPRVVEGMREILFEKLDVKSRVGLAMYAMRLGLIPL